VRGRIHALSESQERLVNLACDERAPRRSRNLSTLRFAPGAAYRLAPLTRYVAALRSAAHPGKALYAFSFTTSRYENFRALIEARVDAFVHHLHRLVDFALEPKPPLHLTPEQRTEIDGIHGARAAGDAAGEDVLHPVDRAAEHAGHERLRALLDIAPYLPTQGTEVFELRDDVDHYGFLVQFSEPVDWRRTRLTAEIVRTERSGSVAVDYPEMRFSVVRNADGTAAFVRFVAGEKTVTEPRGWLEDYYFTGRIDPYLSVEIPHRVRPVKTPGPSFPPAPPDPLPRPHQAVRASPPPAAAPDGFPGVREVTLRSLLVGTLRLIGAAVRITFDRLFGIAPRPRTRRVRLHDTVVDIGLSLVFRYTKDFSRHPDVADWVSFQADNPDLPIFTEQGADGAFETARVEAHYAHSEGSA
jgi:hypothetical protein